MDIKTRSRLNLNSKMFKQLDVCDTQPFFVNGIMYPSVVQAFYSLVIPSSANIIRGMPLRSFFIQKLFKADWEVKDKKELYKIVLSIAMAKCRISTEFRCLLIRTGNTYLVASSYDGYLGIPKNIWGFALMFIRDKRGNIDPNNADEFDDYINSIYEECKAHKNDVKPRRILTNIDRDRYGPYDGCYLDHKPYPGVPDAKLFK